MTYVMEDSEGESVEQANMMWWSVTTLARPHAVRVYLGPMRFDFRCQGFGAVNEMRRNCLRMT